MTHKRSISRLMLAMLALLAVSLSGVLSVAAQDATPGPGVEVERVAVITPGAVTNLGWDQQAADSLTAVAEERDIEAIIQENAGYGDIAPALNDLADEGAQLIICHASGYQTTCPDFAEEENIPVAVIENPTAVTPGLVSDIDTQAQEVAYLAGVAAGQLTGTGTVAVVVSGEPPTWNYMTVGFAEGLKATNGSASLIYSVIGEAAYDDSAGAKRVTEQVLAAGADIVFGMGDGASFGMIEAIREHNAANPDAQAMFIDVIGDKSVDYSDVLLTSVVFDYSGIYDEMIEDLEAGTFGRIYTMNLENEGVRLLELQEGVDQTVQDEIEQARTAIVDGEITVSAIGDTDEMRTKLQELGYS